MPDRASSSPPGQVFTPAHLADRLWRLALDAYRGALPEGADPSFPKVIDPAAGDGAIADAIRRATPAADLTLVELDPSLVTHLRALPEMVSGADEPSLPKGVSSAVDRPAPQGSLVVVHADALTLARGSDAPPSALGRAWGALPPARVAETNRRLVEKGWADIVIANPPYLRETGNRDLFRQLRTWNDGALAPLYRKDADLHVFFWDIAARWLRPGGVLAFLTPGYFMEAESAEPLRRMLTTTGHVHALWRAGHDSSFPDAGVEAAVTVWRKAPIPAESAAVDHTVRLGDDGSAVGAIRLPPKGPWWLETSPEIVRLGALPLRVGDLYRVVEGVSTGANRLRARDAAAVPDGRAGEGIFVLSSDEADTFRGDPAFSRLVRRRQRATSGPDQWILLVRDRDLPRLDEGAEPTTPIERHLSRFRRVLEARAEMRRNPARSWYAVAWPRPELQVEGAIVTPKWSAGPAFAPLSGAGVPMTDCRVLVPRDADAVSARDRVLAWLNGTEIRPWYRQRLKSKGPIVEWYGPPLLGVPLPGF